MTYLLVRNKVMPCPISMSVGHEIIWSANTGRTSNGTMVGDVIAEKKTLDIAWGILTDAEMQTLKRCMTAQFFPVTFKDFGEDVTMGVYRSTLTGQILGTFGGITYWKSVSVKLIQQ